MRDEEVGDTIAAAAREFEYCRVLVVRAGLDGRWPGLARRLEETRAALEGTTPEADEAMERARQLGASVRRLREWLQHELAGGRQ